jgi:hypothetical protein
MITALWMTAITIMAMVVWYWIQHELPFLLLHCLDFRVRTMYIVVTCVLPARGENGFGF